VNIGETESKAMADQLMTTDKARLKSRLGELSKPDVQAVEAAIRLQLGLAK